MGYESVSTIVVLAILVIVMVGWLPGKTLSSMKRVIEHREDRFSPSLHLLDEHSGTRFCDDSTSAMKGAIMEPAQARGSQMRRRHIAEVRRLRHGAIRRRRMLVMALLALTFAVVGLAFAMRFSVLYGLVPLALLIVVVGFGIRASRQARAWERRIAAGENPAFGKNPEARAKSGSASAEHAVDVGNSYESAAAERSSKQSEQAAAVAKKLSSTLGHADEAPTDVMEQREIRRALKRSEADQLAALSRRQGEPAHAVADHAASASGKSAEGEIEPAQAADDATSQLEQVHATHALDAFDMASQQDLISFSLGSARGGNDIKANGPESLEIKSTRQVVVAVPDQSAADRQAANGGGESGEIRLKNNIADDASDSAVPDTAVHDGVVDVALNDAQAFHNAEVEAEVEIPDASSDSLGGNLEAVLARRACS
ncbi:MAG: hypothetical protein LKF99_00625 [Bifidobacterium sp.]|jgi:hypothetical protein|nr:hypothetical protein [Bifidobacterium sp.]